MSRTEDLVLIRAEVANLNDQDQTSLMHVAHTTIREELANQIKRFREQAHEARLTPEQVRSGTCRCPLCQFGRHLDAVGLLAE